MPQRTFYWIIANLNGKLVVIGPKDTEADANSFAYEKLDVEFEIIPLDTRNRARATSIIKAKRLDATGDLAGALQRARHKV